MISNSIINEIYQQVIERQKQPDKNGANSDAFFIVPSDDLEYVVRIPKGSKKNKKRIFYEYKREIEALQILHHQKLPINLPTDMTVVQRNTLSFCIHKIVRGHQPQIEELIKSKQQFQVFCRECALFLSNLHQIPIGKIKTLSKPISGFPKKSAFIKGMTYHTNFTLPEIEKIYQVLLKIRQNIGNDIVVSHQDFHVNNCCIDKSGHLLGVIDWSFLQAADRTTDFLNLWQYPEWAKQVILYYNEIMYPLGVSINIEKAQMLSKTLFAGVAAMEKNMPSSFKSWIKQDAYYLLNIAE